MFFRSLFLPWTAGDLFPSEADFIRWLQKRRQLFDTLRMLCLIPAAILLLIGYISDLRPVMLWTILPLTLVLLLSVALEKISQVLDGQNINET